MKNLPMDLLRAFVSVAQLNSFTKAGEILGRSQPASEPADKALEELLMSLADLATVKSLD